MKISNKIKHRIIKLLLKIRYWLLYLFPTRKIGFLRLYNEENTIIPCIASVLPMADIIVLIHSNIEDSSLDLVTEYIKENKLEKKIIVRRYPHKVYPANDSEYFTRKVKPENTLAAYYEFGYKICRKLARFHNGFIFKIDADQIYVNNCFNEIDKIMKKQKYTRIINSYGGYNGHVVPNLIYGIYHNPETGEINGCYYDHLIIPNGMAEFVYFNMSITDDHAWEVLNLPSIFYEKSKQYDKIMWFHFSHKLTDENLLHPLSKKQYEMYQEQIYPLLKKNNSPYTKLLIKHKE